MSIPVRSHLRRLLLAGLATFAPVQAPLAAQPQPLPVAASAAELGLDPARLDRIGTALDAYVASDELAGGVVLVARNGRLVYHRAFGERDRASGDPMEVDDIFRIASQTKALVSVAAMILQEEGRLLLSDPVAGFLPEFGATTVAVAEEGGGYRVEPARRPVTIRDLMTHTAGVGYGTGAGGDRWADAEITGWYFAHRDEPIRETVRRMAGLPFQAQPGDRFVYGYSTDILGAIVEEASGTPLDRFLADRITGPLGMVDTHFFLPVEKSDRLATVYVGADSGLVRAPDGPGMSAQGQYVAGPRRSFSGGAGLLSTAGDYGRFLQMLLDGGELDGVRILAPTSVELMTVDHVTPITGTESGGTGFGLGFDVITDLGAYGAPGSVGAYGWGGAYHSTYWVDPAEDLVVTYMTQLRGGVPDDHARLRALVYQAIVESR
jgi:CubicO group peptidase (beta-lactamase class C family)